MSTGRGISSPVLDVVRLNKDDILIETSRFESVQMDQMYERIKSYASMDYGSDKNREDAIDVLCSALDFMGWSPMVHEFRKIKKG